MLTIKMEDINGQDDEEPFSKYNKQMDVKVIHGMVYLC